jgi:FixJ family two-component response regulator
MQPSFVRNTSLEWKASHLYEPRGSFTQNERPVLLLIEKHDQGLIWQAMNAGAYDLLVKPVDEATLFFAVHRAIEASRLLFQVKREEEKLMAAVGA